MSEPLFANKNSPMQWYTVASGLFCPAAACTTQDSILKRLASIEVYTRDSRAGPLGTSLVDFKRGKRKEGPVDDVEAFPLAPYLNHSIETVDCQLFVALTLLMPEMPVPLQETLHLPRSEPHHQDLAHKYYLHSVLNLPADLRSRYSGFHHGP